MNRIWLIGFATMILFGCGGPKVMTSHKSDAANFEASGNYSQAIAAWQQYFNQTPIEHTAGADFASAAKTAFRASDNTLALSWFDQARYKNYSDAEMYSTLAKIYRSERL